MSRRVYLHIGTMKSGTSYLQRLWWHHRQELARRGLLVPGSRWYDHRHAAMVVKGSTHGASTRLTRRQRGAWERILAETASARRDAVISNEIFCSAGAQSAREALRRLGEAAEEVHVVLTTRDLGRILPSAWQQRVRHGSGDTFDTYWKKVSREGPGGRFHRHYDVPGILDRWTPGLPPDRVHVVIHPRRGAPGDWLWHRLCEITGVDPAGLDTAVGGSNESLGLAEVEVMREVNIALRSLSPERPILDTTRYLKQTLVRDVLEPSGGERFVAPPEAQAWAIEQGRVAADVVASRGWHIVGDLADLVPEPVQGRAPGDVTGDEVARVAVGALAHELVRGMDHYPLGNGLWARARRGLRHADVRRRTTGRSGQS